MEFSPWFARRALTMILAGLGTASALALTHRTATAQTADTERALVHGRRSIALSLPDGGGSSFQLWRMRSETLNRGLVVHFDADVTEATRDSVSRGRRSVALLAGPAFRRYVGARHPVAPFLQTTLLAGGTYQWDDVHYEGAPSRGNPWTLRGSVGFGLGAEWFPHRSVSLNGYTGARLGATYRSVDARDLWSVGLSTFTSALALQVYF